MGEQFGRMRAPVGKAKMADCAWKDGAGIAAS
jgi:hypothetical protein